MSVYTRNMLGLSAMLAVTACADILGSNDGSIDLPPAFQTVPVGFSANSNSFDESGDAGRPFLPESMGSGVFGGDGNQGPGGNSGPGNNNGEDDDHNGFGRRGLRGLLMGGGLGRDFIGALAFGSGKGRGPFGSFLVSDRCVFNAATGRVVCPTFEKHDVDVNLSFAFRDVNGIVQSKYDTGTTNTVNVQTSVSGTKSRHGDDDDDDEVDDDDDDVTSTVSHTSDRTVGGLATGSTARTVNGVAEAHETTSGTRDNVAFTAQRDAADTTSGLVIPLVDGRPTFPSAGTVIRRMRITITKDGAVAKSRFRREKVTFDGTNVVKLEITQDDVTKNCTITLPSKKLVCE